MTQALAALPDRSRVTQCTSLGLNFPTESDAPLTFDRFRGRIAKRSANDDQRRAGRQANFSAGHLSSYA